MASFAISHSAHRFKKSETNRPCSIPSHLLSYNRAIRLKQQRYQLCKLSMNGCQHANPNGTVEKQQLQTIQTRTLEAVSTSSAAIDRLTSAVADLKANPPPLSSGIIRLQVPIQQQISAVDWLHSQRELLPRCFFSGRNPSMDSDAELILPANGNDCSSARCNLIRVAGVGSAVYFRNTCPFGIDDWRSIKSEDSCPRKAR